MRGPRERIPLGTASGECTGAVGLVESRACDSAVWTRRPSVQTAVGWTVAQCAHYGNCACTCVCVHISGAVLSGAPYPQGSFFPLHVHVHAYARVHAGPDSSGLPVSLGQGARTPGSYARVLYSACGPRPKPNRWWGQAQTPQLGQEARGKGAQASGEPSIPEGDRSAAPCCRSLVTSLHQSVGTHGAHQVPGHFLPSSPSRTALPPPVSCDVSQLALLFAATRTPPPARATPWTARSFLSYSLMVKGLAREQRCASLQL